MGYIEEKKGYKDYLDYQYKDLKETIDNLEPLRCFAKDMKCSTILSTAMKKRIERELFTLKDEIYWVLNEIYRHLRAIDKAEDFNILASREYFAERFKYISELAGLK